jgi:hypothetical protein
VKTKNVVAKEDPEAKARREVEQARAEADKTSALQQLLDRRSRKILRIFGKPQGGATAAGDGGGSGAGVVGGYVPNIGNIGGGGFMAGAGGGGDFGGMTYQQILDSEGGYASRNGQFWY